MTVGEFKKWLVENKVVDSAEILLAPAGRAYQEFEPYEYDNDVVVGPAVLVLCE